MLTRLAIWYLSKKKVSVMIGMSTYGGKIKYLHPLSSTYNSTIMHTRTFDANNEQFLIPSGKKFKIVDGVRKY
jgi:hypothetical protein